MRFYGEFDSENAVITPMIDFIEFEFPHISKKFVPKDLDNTDVVLSCDWDESDWAFDEKTGHGSFRVKGVYINQIYANGHIADFYDAKVDTIQVRADTDVKFRLLSLTVDDGDDEFEIPSERLVPWMIQYES